MKTSTHSQSFPEQIGIFHFPNLLENLCFPWTRPSSAPLRASLTAKSLGWIAFLSHKNSPKNSSLRLLYCSPETVPLSLIICKPFQVEIYDFCFFQAKEFCIGVRPTLSTIATLAAESSLPFVHS